jgi:hypothetical protein
MNRKFIVIDTEATGAYGVKGVKRLPPREVSEADFWIWLDVAGNVTVDARSHFTRFVVLDEHGKPTGEVAEMQYRFEADAPVDDIKLSSVVFHD